MKANKLKNSNKIKKMLIMQVHFNIIYIIFAVRIHAEWIFDKMNNFMHSYWQLFWLLANTSRAFKPLIK